MAFYLPKPTGSIFCGRTMWETAPDDLVNGFIQHKLGIGTYKKGKYIGKHFKSELILMENYAANRTSPNVYENTYTLPSSGWGRIEPKGHLSLSVMNQQTRHSLCVGKYVDFDMVNCQVEILRQKAISAGLGSKIPRLIEYCDAPKEIRLKVVDFHKLEPYYDSVVDDYPWQPKDQAKNLMIALAFGGSYDKWKDKFKVGSDRMGFVDEIQKELEMLSKRIYAENPEMVADLMKKPDWSKKSDKARARSAMATWCQTLEHLCQEKVAWEVILKYGLNLNWTVPSQDGFMLLEDDVVKYLPEDHTELLEFMKASCEKELGLSMTWSVKEFDNPLPNGIPKFVEALTVDEKRKRVLDKVLDEPVKQMIKSFNPKASTKLCFADSDFGEAFVGLYADNYCFCNGIIYHFNGVYWEADNKNHTHIQLFINTVFCLEMKRWIKDKISGCLRGQAEDDATDDESGANDKHMAFWSRLNIYVGEYLKAQRSNELLIKMICSKICNDRQEWDLNPHIFVFENCVFNLLTGKEETPNPKHFMTSCCGWAYNKNYKCDDKLDKLLESIFKDKTVRDYILAAFASGLTGIQNRSVYIFTGVGGNGKSLIDEFFLYMLGEYGYVLPKTFLTQPFKDGANPEAMNLHNKRSVIVSEPDASKNICCSSLKAMSGDAVISSRQLYGAVEKVIIRATNFIECNTAPNLDEMNDAMTDRLGEGVIEFPACFVKQSVYNAMTEEDQAKVGIQNAWYKTDEFKDGYKQELFNTLLPFVTAKVPVPQSVVKASRIYLSKSDMLYDWFVDNYDPVEGEAVKVRSLYTFFRNSTSFTWNKAQKEMFATEKKFVECVRKNVFMRKLVKDRNEYYGAIQLSSLSICGWREKVRGEDE